MKNSDRKSYSGQYNINFLTGQFTSEINNKSNQNSSSSSDDKIHPLFTIHPNSVLELRDCNIKSGNYYVDQYQPQSQQIHIQTSQQFKQNSLKQWSKGSSYDHT